MLAAINRLLDWLKSLFWKEEMELTLVGLQNSGKTTFVNVIAVSTLLDTPLIHVLTPLIHVLAPLIHVLILLLFLVWSIYGRHDSNGRIQYAKSDQGKRYDQSESFRKRKNSER